MNPTQLETPAVPKTPIPPPSSAPPENMNTNYPADMQAPSIPPQAPTNPPDPPFQTNQPTTVAGNNNKSKKFPLGILLIFFVFILVAFAGSVLYFGFIAPGQTKKTDSSKITVPTSVIAPNTVIPTITTFQNPFASPSASFQNPFASPSASFQNPFGNYKNPFTSDTGSTDSASYQNPFNGLK